MLKAFLKIFNIEEALEAHMSWNDMEAQKTWKAQSPKKTRHQQLIEGLKSALTQPKGLSAEGFAENAKKPSLHFSGFRMCDLALIHLIIAIQK